MFEINNATINFYNNGEISFMSANIADQQGDTIFKLGRGRMLKTSHSSKLKYNLTNDILLILRTD